MAPTKTGKRPSKAQVERFESRTEADPLGSVQPDTDAEFTADGRIPPGAETDREYLERIAPKDKTKPARRS